jgi:hypothetical protein
MAWIWHDDTDMRYPDLSELSAEYARLLALQAQAIREFDQEELLGEARRVKLDAVRGACLATEAARIRLIRR